MDDQTPNNVTDNDNQNVQDTNDRPNSNTPLVQDTKPVGGNEPSQTPTTDTQDTFSKEYVENLRKENANWRTKLRDLEGKFDSLTEQLRQKDIQQTKMQAIQDYGLPSDAMEFLTGEDADTIKAQAEKFKNLLPEPQEAGSQTNPRRAMTALPGGEPRQETREQKNSRLGLSPSSGNNIS